MFTYLFLDLFSISIPLSRSFEPRVKFYSNWKALIPAILIPALFFIVWDIWFTSMGVWGFNPRYLSGLDVINLPVEEWLFFICIPYACLFTYEALNYFIKKDYLRNSTKYISAVLVIILLSTALINLDKWYTATTFILCSWYIIYLTFINKAPYLSRFYFAYIVILVPFFIINGILTGSFIEDQVVWYNNDENLGIRFGTIPVEDTFYGMLLIMMNVSVFERFRYQK